MGDSDAPPLNAGAILRALLDQDVQFVIVGGFAGEQHGATRGTNDIDICPAWTDDNLQRVTNALQRLGALLKEPGGRLTRRPSARFLRNMEISTWRSPAGDVDVLLGIPRNSRWELAQYRQLLTNALAVEFTSDRVLIASLDDLVRSKEIANRPSDRAHLPELMALRDGSPPPLTSTDAKPKNGV